MDYEKEQWEQVHQEKDHTLEIKKAIEQNTLRYLNSLDAAMLQYGPTRECLVEFAARLDELIPPGDYNQMADRGLNVDDVYNLPVCIGSLSSDMMKEMHKNLHQVLKDYEHEHCVDKTSDKRVIEVFDVFKEYPDDPDHHNIWIGLISAGNRAGYLCIDGEKHSAYENALSSAEPLKYAKELLESDASVMEKFNNRPCIEDASFAMQKTLEAAKEMESMILFVSEDDCPVWKNHGLSRQEYERQMDVDIEKYGLSKVVVKNEEDCLYVCYQDFLCSFTEKGREKVREAVPVESEPVKALISTDEASLGKIKEQFGVEVQYTDKTAFLLEPFHHSNILEEIDYLANSLYDYSKYGEAVLNDDKRRKELFNEVCFRLDRAVSADDDGLNWAQAREVIEQCFRHEKEKFDHPVRKAAVR